MDESYFGFSNRQWGKQINGKSKVQGEQGGQNTWEFWASNQKEQELYICEVYPNNECLCYLINNKAVIFGYRGPFFPFLWSDPEELYVYSEDS